jgi:hypothetical protein
MLGNLKDTLDQKNLREIWQSLTKTDKLNVGERERLSS